MAGRRFALAIVGVGCGLFPMPKDWLKQLGMRQIPKVLDVKHFMTIVFEEIKRMFRRPANPVGRSRGASSK